MGGRTAEQAGMLRVAEELGYGTYSHHCGDARTDTDKRSITHVRPIHINLMTPYVNSVAKLSKASLACWGVALRLHRRSTVCASLKPKLENYESVQHRLQFSGIKKGTKISFYRHFKDVT